MLRPGVYMSNRVKFMHCTDEHISEYLDEMLPQLQKQAFEQHLSECKTCSSRVNDMRKILTGLNRMPVAGPSAGFEGRVFKEVRRQHQQQSSNLFLAGFITATAASMALWFLSTLIMVQQQSLPTSDTFTVAMNNTQSIRLLFDAPENIDQVTLSIDIPDNFELSGHSGRSQLSWNTSLIKGQNVLTLPVIAVIEGQGELVARLSYGDKEKTFRITLKTADDGVMNYQVQPVKSV